MIELQTVTEEAGRLVTPDAEQEARLQRIARKTMAKVSAAAAQFKEVEGVSLGGSFAKGTWLPGDVDLDIFLKIAPGVDDARFEYIGLRVGREAARGYRHGKKYAQHPYTESIVDGTRVNVVPCYNVRAGEWKSAADRSLYHVKFVQKNMDEAKKTQVRLLKRFMKVIGVYGAEIQSEGFSGYAAEVLVHSHGSFEAALRYFAGLQATGEKLFVLMDPIDEERELSKAMSNESVARMVLASRAFLDAPDLRFFRKVLRHPKKRLVGRVYALRFDHRQLSEDTLWGELKKSTRRLVKHLEEEGFSISRAAACSNNLDGSAIVFLPETDSLSGVRERVGPGVERASDARDFVSKNRGKAELVWAGEDGRLHILQKRESTELWGSLKELTTGTRVSRIGASRDMAEWIRKNGRVLRGGALRKEMNDEPWLREGVETIVADTIGAD